MEHQTEITTITKVELRNKELEQIIIEALKNKGFSNTDKYVKIDFVKKAFSEQEDGLNAYDEIVAKIIITKLEKH